MTSPVLQEVKRKMVIGVSVRVAVVAIVLGVFWFYYTGNVSVGSSGEVAPIVYGFFGLIGLIFLVNVMSYLWRMRKLLGLVSTMQQISQSYGMEFVTDGEELGKKYFFHPVECLIRGKRSGKDVLIYPALDISNGKSDRAQSVTVFERPLGRALIPVSIVKNGGLMSVVGSLLGGMKTVFRNDYLVLAPGLKWAKSFSGDVPKFGSAEEWNGAVLAQMEEIFPADALASYDMLPGRKTLLVTNQSVLLSVKGFVQDLNQFEKYLTFMERLG